jgi:hypothetical protein
MIAVPEAGGASARQNDSSVAVIAPSSARRECSAATALSLANGLAPRASACARDSMTRNAPAEPSAKPPAGPRDHTGAKSVFRL